jgi:1-deoxy-D-xylulose 5-phosphate reductoisomerase
MNYLAARKMFFLVLLFPILTAAAQAQVRNETAAEENFTLNISQETIRETDFERSTKVETADREGNVSVRVGAAVNAKNAVITLRGITGNVTFRASLEIIERLLEDRKKSSEP